MLVHIYIYFSLCIYINVFLSFSYAQYTYSIQGQLSPRRCFEALLLNANRYSHRLEDMGLCCCLPCFVTNLD